MKTQAEIVDHIHKLQDVQSAVYNARDTLLSSDFDKLVLKVEQQLVALRWTIKPEESDK